MAEIPPDLSAAAVIDKLALKPHPEGGFYRETFRDPHDAHNGRAASTAIYFLLPAGVLSRWHRVDAAEVWHWYAGSPLRLSLGSSQQTIRHLVLGGDLSREEAPQAIVPAHHWQQAESLGAWTLAGCTVAPGFTFDGFEIITSDQPPPNGE